MKDIRDLQDLLDHLRETIEGAQLTAQKLAREQLIDRSAVPMPRRPERELLREF